MNNDSKQAPLHPNAKTKSPRLIIIGFVTGAVLWLLTLLPKKNYSQFYVQLYILLFACFVVPVLAAIFAAVPRTRKFGLGLLLASGLGWLVLGAICGGVFR